MCTHLNGQRNLTNHVASMRTDHAAALDVAVAVDLGAVIKQAFGDAFVAAIGDGVAGCRPREQPLQKK